MKILLMIFNVIFAVGILVWPLTFYVSIFFFDAPGSTSNQHLWALAYSLWGYPVPAIIGNLIFWRNRNSDDNTILMLSTALSGSGYLLVLLAWSSLGGL